jgi:methylthioribose-1-phosphate isomerase
MIRSVNWLGDCLQLLDQTKLPAKEAYLTTTDYRVVASAITKMQVRGAPAIGVAAAYGIALGAFEFSNVNLAQFRSHMSVVMKTMAATRPTAKNLFTTIERMESIIQKTSDTCLLKQALIEEAIKIHSEEQSATQIISKLGANLFRDGDTILTHCNAGPLATAGYGTAIGALIEAQRQGKNIRVINTETRPLLQGSRLTAWELKVAGIPFKLITDSMAAYFMSKGSIQAIIVGADRIAKNGDVVNKIGTYMLAVLARENNIPFYVAAPLSTFDYDTPSGEFIPIEERNTTEITEIYGTVMTPEGTEVLNPAFDITPTCYITAIISEKGVAWQGKNSI